MYDNINSNNYIVLWKKKIFINKIIKFILQYLMLTYINIYFLQFFLFVIKKIVLSKPFSEHFQKC